MMGEPFVGFSVLSLFTSALAVLVLGVYLVRTGLNHGRYHDRRSSVQLLIALVLFVAALGTMLSAFGLIAVGETNTWRIYGLSMTRGALLVGGLVILALDRYEK